MLKMMGLVDIFAGLALFSISAGISHKESFILIIILLLMKSSIDFSDIGGALDLVAAIMIFLSFFFLIPSGFLLVGGFLILIKGIISLFS